MLVSSFTTLYYTILQYTRILLALCGLLGPTFGSPVAERTLSRGVRKAKGDEAAVFRTLERGTLESSPYPQSDDQNFFFYMCIYKNDTIYTYITVSMYTCVYV